MKLKGAIVGVAILVVSAVSGLGALESGDLSQQAEASSPPSTTVNSMAELRTLGAASGWKSVLLNGYYSPGDGAGGHFYWDASSTAADDGGVTIWPNGTAQGRWKR